MPSQNAAFEAGPKHQTPNTKLQRNTNLQTPKAIPAALSQICLPAKDVISLADFSEVGSLGFLWVLDFGIWSFAFRPESTTVFGLFALARENAP